MKQELKLNLSDNLRDNFIKARNNYFLALAINETNLSIDRQSKQEVLNENKFYSNSGRLRKRSNYGQLITSPDSDYNMSDSDFKKYSKLAHIKRVKKGLKLPYHKYEWAIKEPWNLSADCESRPLLRESEKVLIKASLEILPQELRESLKDIDEIQNYMQLQKYIQIVLQLDIPNHPIPTTKELLRGVF